MIGTKFAHYEVTGHLGTGGMGEVYEAIESRLGRRVAIKLLPAALDSDSERLALFRREAQVLASLNHPNIAQIYGLEESGDKRCIVMELVEGETLQSRIKRGPIPVDESLAIAKQIAEALEAAHEKGVTHRDLKPANIKLTPGGTVKILDFGLAKTRTAAADANVNLTSAPTVATSMAGMIVGTSAYMSPEQAKGRETDRTADIWSFGCVFYEMLTGRQLFEGETVSEILADVLKTEPNWERLPAETPAGIRRLLRRCLRKDQKSRLRDIGDARIEIADAEGASEASAVAAVAVPPASHAKERMAWAALLIVMAVVGAAGARYFNRPAASPEMRVDIATPPTFDPVAIAISPDGQKLVYVAEGRSQLWLRQLNSPSGKPLPGTNNAVHPFWSPDNRSLGFIADGKLKTIDTENGSIRVLANAPNARGGTWNKNDVILFTPLNPGLVYRIAASGGKPEAVTQVEPGRLQGNHLFPHFLPDGQHFLYYDAGAAQTRGVYVDSLNGGKATRLFDAESAAIYSSGHLLFVHQGMLMAQRFDLDRLNVNGDPFPVSESVIGGQRPALAATFNGTIVYRRFEPAPAANVPFYMAWLDRTGKEVGAIRDLQGVGHWSITSDGRNFVMERGTDGNIDIWRIDFGRGVQNRVTTDPVADTFPIWSPNGERIVFTSNRKTITYDLYVTLADKPGNDELLLASNENKIATDWSSDGKYILYRNFSENTGYDIWAVPVDANGRKNGEPISVVSSPADERDGQFSPDAKWVAYQSNDTGVFEVYVQPFPGGGAKYQVSKGGGSQVRWNPNGKELFYVALDGRLMSVPMKLDSIGQHFEAGTPMALFPTTLRGNEVQTTNRQQFAVSADGQRFLIRGIPATPNTTPLTLILNWQPK